MTRLQAVILLALALSLAAQQAQGQHQPAQAAFPHIDWAAAARSGFLADTVARSLDVYSTHRMLAHDGHEVILPGFISHHPAAMTAYSAGAVTGNEWLARRLVKKGHPRLAKLLVWGDAAQVGWLAGRNFTVSGPVGKPGERKIK